MQNHITPFMTLLGVLFFTPVICAQSGTVTAGGDATGSGGSVSFSVGQMDYISISSTDGTVYQGLQHPYEISEVTSVSHQPLDIAASLHPNPVKDYLYLNVPDELWQGLKITLIDIQGRSIHEEQLVDQSTIIAMQQTMPGTYFLIIQNEKNQIKSFKIIKP